MQELRVLGHRIILVCKELCNLDLYISCKWKHVMRYLKMCVNSRKISQLISVNQGVRHGCSISHNLFNIYIDDLVRKSVSYTHLDVYKRQVFG